MTPRHFAWQAWRLVTSTFILRGRRGTYVQETNWDAQREKAWLTLTLMLVRRKSACKTSAGSSKIFRWLAPLLGPNLDPKTGPKQRPKRRNENVIQFWTPFWGPYLDPKNGVSHRRISLLPANVLQADLQPSSLNMNVNTYPFSLCASQGRLLLSRSLYRSHVLNTFFGPVLGAMMKQVCWHSRRSEAHRGLPEARPRTQKRNGTRTKRGSRGLESIYQDCMI